MRSDGGAISDAGSRITKAGSSIVYQNLMSTDSGNYTVVVMHPAGKRMLPLTIYVGEFAVHNCTCTTRTDV